MTATDSRKLCTRSCWCATTPGATEYWVPFHDAMSRLGATAPADVRLLAETFADPVTASVRALSELDHEIEQLRNTEDDALIIRTAIAGFYADRLRGCREALFRVVRDGREGGAVGSAMMALSMLAYDELNAGRWDEALQLVAEATDMWARRADTACMGGPAPTPGP